METQRGDVQMGFYDEFDMEAYIDRRMLEITEPGERILFKEIVGNLLKEVYRYNKEAYRGLCDRVLSEETAEQGAYAVCVALTDKDHYDETDPFLSPMLPEDTRKKELSCEEVREALGRGEEIRLFTVFLKAGASALYGMLREKRQFHGVIETENREYRGTFQLKRSERYLRQIERLYEIFTANCRPWSTVCGAYLMKLFDVVLRDSEEIGKGETIRRVEVDFEDYAGLAVCDVIPLWNLREFQEKTSTYPDAALDRINYEHQIFAHRLRADCEYLVTNTEVEITNIRRVKGDLVISCPEERPVEWSFYQVSRESGQGRYPYPPLSNRCKESFAGSITEMYRKSIRTKAEMARLIESFPAGDGLVFKGCAVGGEAPEGWEACNYNMDDFIQDEIRGGARQILLISFAATDPESYLNEDRMSFLVSQVQKLFPEYRCIGQIE